MKSITALLLIVAISSCTNSETEQVYQVKVKKDTARLDTLNKILEEELPLTFDTLISGLNFIADNNYSATKAKVRSTRQQLSTKYHNSNRDEQNSIIDSASQLLTAALLNEIIPYWYGTPWDFNGHTATPNKGEIACGYFVSTTLQHMGLNLNRYKLAQQGPLNEARSIAIDTNTVLHYNYENINSALKELTAGLYFVGVDSHVGYLYIHNNKSYFIHSDYISMKVRVEETAASPAFSSDNYYISPISANKLLIKKWLTYEVIRIFTT